MTIEGAVIIEKGVTFAVIHVDPSVTRYTIKSTQTRRALMRFFPGMPIILMSLTPDGHPQYYGRKDIADVLRRARLHHIPWKTYQMLDNKTPSGARSCAFFNGSSFYSAGMMNERELKIFFVTFGVSVGKPTSTPMTLSPLFAMRTET